MRDRGVAITEVATLACVTDPPDRQRLPEPVPAVPDENGCTPLTCATADLECGIAADGCGGYVDCHSCSILGEWGGFEGWASAIGVSRSRQEVYVVRWLSAEAGSDGLLTTLSVHELTTVRTLEIPRDARDLIVDDEQSRICLRFVHSPTLRVVDIADQSLRTFDLPPPVVAPALGPAIHEVAQLSLVPGRTDRLAVYAQVPEYVGLNADGEWESRAAIPAGLWLIDPENGRVVARQDHEPGLPLLRSLFAGGDGVVYAGLNDRARFWIAVV